jgi:TatD DNase family protein
MFLTQKDMPKKIIIPEPETNLKFIDVHCHLPFPRPSKNDKLPADEEQYSKYFQDGGIYLISSSIDVNTLSLIRTFIKDKENMGFTCGWAPQTVTYTSKNIYKKEWDKWIDFIQNNTEEFLAVGEIGLDFHHAKTLEKRERQIEEFRKILDFTIDLNKPYILHVRNAGENEYDRENPKHRFNKKDGATQEILKILNESKINPNKVMWHCFSGPLNYGFTLSKSGFMLSVPSSAYGNKRWLEPTMSVPLESLLTETDSYYQHPYLRGPVNVPSNVKYSIAALAYSHHTTQKIVSEQTIKNAINFFNLKIK